MQHAKEQFIKAYDKYADAIFRHCYFRVYERERARELMQETFMKAWQYMMEHGEVRNIRAFLYRIATNAVIDESRKRKSVSLDELTAQGFDLLDERALRIHRHVEGKELCEKLAFLDENYRVVLVMRFIDDLRPKEIARILDESENVISVRINRGLKKLHELYEK